MLLTATEKVTLQNFVLIIQPKVMSTLEGRFTAEVDPVGPHKEDKTTQTQVSSYTLTEKKSACVPETWSKLQGAESGEEVNS